MTKSRNALQPEPVHARAVLAQLVRAGVDVELAAIVFVGHERKACTWLLQRGWARRSRARCAGQLTYAATEAGRLEHERFAALSDEARRAERMASIVPSCKAGAL